MHSTLELAARQRVSDARPDAETVHANLHKPVASPHSALSLSTYMHTSESAWPLSPKLTAGCDCLQTHHCYLSTQSLEYSSTTSASYHSWCLTPGHVVEHFAGVCTTKQPSYSSGAHTALLQAVHSSDWYRSSQLTADLVGCNTTCVVHLA